MRVRPVRVWGAPLSSASSARSARPWTLALASSTRAASPRRPQSLRRFFVGARSVVR